MIESGDLVLTGYFIQKHTCVDLRGTRGGLLCRTAHTWPPPTPGTHKRERGSGKPRRPSFKARTWGTVQSGPPTWRKADSSKIVIGQFRDRQFGRV